MNDNIGDATPAALPELSDERIDDIESALFDRIGRERGDSGRRARRGRSWIIGAGTAAAVVVLAIAIAPAVGGLVSVGGGAGSSAVAPDAAELVAPGADTGERTDADASVSAPEAAPGISPVTAPERQIITSAAATVRVDDVAASIRAVASAAEGRGGFVESSSVGSTGVTSVPEGGVSSDIYAPVPTDGGWITVRVPADQLSAAIDALSEVGDVEASSINRQDVTAQSIDLQARIDAAQASVDRLTALMAQAGSLADLLAAETALSERQATLESYQQQREALDDQVDLSSLTVTVVPRVETVTADPAGFGDGLVAGWNGLVASLNGIVVAIGFLLPWLAVIAIAGAIVWGIVRLVRRRRRPRDAATPAS